MSSLYDIKKSALEDLKEQLEGNAEFDNGELYISIDEHDTIFEIADSNVPTYTYDILQMAADNIELAIVEPDIGPAFDGTPTPVNIIAANIYEEITQELWSNLESIKESIGEECESCGNRVADDTLLEHLDGDISLLVCKDCENDLLDDEEDSSKALRDFK